MLIGEEDLQKNKALFSKKRKTLFVTEQLLMSCGEKHTHVDMCS